MRDLPDDHGERESYGELSMGRMGVLLTEYRAEVPTGPKAIDAFAGFTLKSVTRATDDRAGASSRRTELSARAPGSRDSGDRKPYSQDTEPTAHRKARGFGCREKGEACR